MRCLLVTVAVVALFGCAGNANHTGRVSTGPTSSAEPDPFALLGRDTPIGMRLDLAAVRGVPGGSEFDAILHHLERIQGLPPIDLTRDALDRTDIVVFGSRPLEHGEDAVIIVRGRYADLEFETRVAGDPSMVAATHRERRVFFVEDRLLALLDDHLIVYGTRDTATGAIDRYLDRFGAVPGSPAASSPWAYEDTQFLAIVLPTPRIRDELRRTPPFADLASPLQRIALRVMRTPSGELAEARVETTSSDAARGLAETVQDLIGESERDYEVQSSGLGVLLRALRVEVDDGLVRIVGESPDADVVRFLRAALNAI